MTQFALVVTKKDDVGLMSLSDKSDDFHIDIAKKIFPNVSANELYIFNIAGKDIDQLMLDAQKNILENMTFQETSVFHWVWFFFFDDGFNKTAG